MDQFLVFVYMLMRDASLKQRIPCIIQTAIFGTFSAGKKCASYTGKYGIGYDIPYSESKQNTNFPHYIDFQTVNQLSAKCWSTVCRLSAFVALVQQCSWPKVGQQLVKASCSSLLLH